MNQEAIKKAVKIVAKARDKLSENGDADNAFELNSVCALLTLLQQQPEPTELTKKIRPFLPITAAKDLSELCDAYDRLVAERDSYKAAIEIEIDNAEAWLELSDDDIESANLQTRISRMKSYLKTK